MLGYQRISAEPVQGLAAKKVQKRRSRLIRLSLRRLGRLLDDSVKRTFDVAGAFFLLMFAFPVMVLVAAATRLSSPGPSIYLQRRLTKGGRTFTIFKFRSMAKTAESETGAVMATEGDSRITRLGSFLRKTRLDELPQLINVLIGDMSLIGPRPERPEIARELTKQLPLMNERLRVKAGLTGLAQIKHGYVSDADSYQEKLDWDIHYITHRSLLLDIKICFLTVWVVLSGYGAR